MYHERHISSRLQRLMSAFPAVVVSGARQVGKSTLVRALFGGSGGYVVFDPFVDVENARRDPDLFLDSHPERPLLLDEIQCAPEIVGALKRRIDRDRRPGQFVLTGSQQWQVIRSLSESLAGRAVFLDLEGFSVAEARREPDPPGWLGAWLEGEDPGTAPESFAGAPGSGRTLYETLWRGSLPEANLLELDLLPAFFEAYLRTYIERDVRTLSDIGDFAAFTRFVQLAAALTAQEINYSHLGREIGLTPQTARRWLALLEGTFQVQRVEAYSNNAVKRVSGKPKGVFADTGLACALQRISTPAALGGHPFLGALFETLVGGEIRKLAALVPTPPRFHHWRSAGGAEVDLLLERDGRFFPVEVKLSSHPSRRDTSGIAAFRRAYPGLPVAPGMVVAPVSRPFRLSESDWAVPWNPIGPASAPG